MSLPGPLDAPFSRLPDAANRAARPPARPHRVRASLLHVALPLALPLLALALRAWALDAHTPWFDELLELGRAGLPLAERVVGRPIDQDPPLYALALGAWLALGPTGPAAAWWARVPSALAGAVLVALVGAWGRARAGAAVGGTAALLVALAPVAVHYGREINQYAFVLPLAVGLLVAWEAVRRRGTPRAWAALTGLSLAALATHYGLVFPLAVVGADLARQARARRRWGPWVAWVAVLALAAAGLFALGLGDRLAVDHVQRRFGGTDLAKEWGYIADVGWREVLVFTFLPFAGGVALPIVRALSLLAAVGAVSLWRRGPSGRRVVGGWLGGTLALTYLASLFGLYPLGYRHGLFNAPVWLLLVAGGIHAAARPLGRAATAARLALTAAVAAAFLAFSPLALWDNPNLTVPREDLGPVWAAVAARRAPGEGLYVYHGAELATRFLAGAPEGVTWGRPIDSRDAAAARREAARIAAAAAPSGRVWTVWTHVHPAERAALEASLLRDTALRATARFDAPGAFAARYEVEPSAAAAPLAPPPARP